MKHVYIFEKKKDFEEFEIIVQGLSAKLLDLGKSLNSWSKEKGLHLYE
ncbi:hypothetical protein [Peribacillus kribbensis]|nr:hypothetical protein [Peribacillus kribbensis]